MTRRYRPSAQRSKNHYLVPCPNDHPVWIWHRTTLPTLQSYMPTDLAVLIGQYVLTTSFRVSVRCLPEEERRRHWEDVPFEEQRYWHDAPITTRYLQPLVVVQTLQIDLFPDLKHLTRLVERLLADDHMYVLGYCPPPQLKGRSSLRDAVSSRFTPNRIRRSIRFLLWWVSTRERGTKRHMRNSDRSVDLVHFFDHVLQTDPAFQSVDSIRQWLRSVHVHTGTNHAEDNNSNDSNNKG